MMDLQRRGCHNINLVTPTHFLPWVLRALKEALGLGLSIPIVYNNGGYETVESLALQGILLALFAFALLWTFMIEPRRLKVTSVMVPEASTPLPPIESDAVTSIGPDADLVRSLERMDADLAEMREEIARIKRRLGAGKS